MKALLLFALLARISAPQAALAIGPAYLAASYTAVGYCKLQPFDQQLVIWMANFAAAHPGWSQAAFFAQGFDLLVSYAGIAVPAPYSLSYNGASYPVAPGTGRVNGLAYNPLAGSLAFGFARTNRVWQILFSPPVRLSLLLVSRATQQNLLADFAYSDAGPSPFAATRQLSSPLALATGCVQFTFANPCAALDPGTVLRLTAPVYNPAELNPLYRTHLFEGFSAAACGAYYNGARPAGVTCSLQDNVLVVSNLFQGSAALGYLTQTVKLCFVKNPFAFRSPRFVLSLLSNGNVYAESSFYMVSASAFPLYLLNAAQQSQLAGAPFDTSVDWATTVRLFVSESLTFRVTLPAQYASVPMIFASHVSKLDGSTSPAAGSFKVDNAPTFDITFTQVNISVQKGGTLRIFGFNNGILEGTFNLGLQILNNGNVYSVTSTVPHTLTNK